ncbi:MAG: SUMF1/EgtB/PvdO family nonheme iron enzyme [Myxococcota bacterium]
MFLAAPACALLAGCFTDPPPATEGSSTSAAGSTTSGVDPETSADSSTTDDDASTGSTGLGTTGSTGTGTTGSAGFDTDADDATGLDGGCMPIPGMVCIPEGTFLRGSAKDGPAPMDEQPQENITLSAFQIDRFEVTVSDYAECEAEGVCTTRVSTVNTKDPCTVANDDPANCVTWDQANTYCEWADKKLPTEAQWERAARGTSGDPFPWGINEPSCSLAVFDDCGTNSPAAVGSRSPTGDSPEGISDMAGNVFEWTADWYAPGAYVMDPNDNPVGPPTGRTRVMRGGFYGSPMHDIRTANRQEFMPEGASPAIGFRCAAPAPPMP